MADTYTLSERGIVEERGTVCDMCSHRLWPGEHIFFLRLRGSRTEQLCRACSEHLLGHPIPEEANMPNVVSNVQSMKEAAQLALDIQDACNLSAVVNELKRITHEVLWPEAQRLGQGTEFVNQHPIVTVLLDKLVSLNRQTFDPSDANLMKAYDEVKKLAGRK